MITRTSSTAGSINHKNLYPSRGIDTISNLNSSHLSFYKHTNHSEQRANQRGVCDDVVKLVISYGKVIRKQGLQFHLGTTKNFPKNIDHKLVEKCRDVVVVADGYDIITCYKNSKAIKRIKKKAKRLSR